LNILTKDGQSPFLGNPSSASSPVSSSTDNKFNNKEKNKQEQSVTESTEVVPEEESEKDQKSEPNDDEFEWYYLDATGLLQGPSRTIDMSAWFEEGYLDSTLDVAKVKKGSEKPTKFVKLETFQTNNQNPFIEENQNTTQSNGNDESATTQTDQTVEYEWYYKGKDGDIQGPCSQIDMKYWNEDGYFESDLEIAKVVKGGPQPTQWTKLNVLQANGQNPFDESQSS